MSFLVFLLSLTSFTSLATAERCDYHIQVKTGDVDHAGTDSRINLKLISSSGETLDIYNLIFWGGSKGHDHFERGQLDHFKARDTCVQPCAITVRSNGKGLASGWYLEYVDVAVTGHGINFEEEFDVNTWLDNVGPYKLQVTVNKCSGSSISKPTLSSV
ncbi:hypothetical protein QN277_029273 [Acacia crassicarpa]|nr:hypothetical protein QN277_029271 [Acacia crassicarpa]KAK4263922.1 hypothetical protein QN277_029273 [Acacia crassicarpa]